MTDFALSNPEKEQFSLLLPNTPIGAFEISQFTEYSFGSNFLTPVDGFSFSVAGDNLERLYEKILVPGQEVQLILAGRIQFTGYIDAIEKTVTRSGGTEWHIEGRDRLGQCADACSDPNLKVTESMTLLEAMKHIFKDYGWSDDEHFAETNEEDIELKAGRELRSKRRKSDQKGFGKRRIKDYQMHQYRPYAQESVLDFALRITQRFGLWIWASADGKQLIIDEPDFDQQHGHMLYRSKTGSNVTDGSVRFDLSEQPTHIVADSYSKGGEFGRGRSTVITANAAVDVAGHLDGEPFPQFDKYKASGARVILQEAAAARYTRMIAPRVRILYLHDDESHTSEHVENYVRQQMAQLQRKSLTVHYTTQGHGQIVNDVFVPWLIDTVVRVEDEIGGVSEDLYVLGVQFSKSRSGGTTTKVDLIRLHTMVFSDTGK